MLCVTLTQPTQIAIKINKQKMQLDVEESTLASDMTYIDFAPELQLAIATSSLSLA